MDKKKIIIIVSVLIFVILIFAVKTKVKNKTVENNIINEYNAEISLKFNNEINMYEIINERTGEVITTIIDEESAKIEQEFYKEYPDYRANPPASPNAEENIEY